MVVDFVMVYYRGVDKMTIIYVLAAIAGIVINICGIFLLKTLMTFRGTGED